MKLVLHGKALPIDPNYFAFDLIGLDWA